MENQYQEEIKRLDEIISSLEQEAHDLRKECEIKEKKEYYARKTQEQRKEKASEIEKNVPLLKRIYKFFSGGFRLTIILQTVVVLLSAISDPANLLSQLMWPSVIISGTGLFAMIGRNTIERSFKYFSGKPTKEAVLNEDFFLSLFSKQKEKKRLNEYERSIDNYYQQLLDNTEIHDVIQASKRVQHRMYCNSEKLCAAKRQREQLQKLALEQVPDHLIEPPIPTKEASLKSEYVKKIGG